MGVRVTARAEIESTSVRTMQGRGWETPGVEIVLTYAPGQERNALHYLDEAVEKIRADVAEAWA